MLLQGDTIYQDLSLACIYSTNIWIPYQAQCSDTEWWHRMVNKIRYSACQQDAPSPFRQTNINPKNTSINVKPHQIHWIKGMKCYESVKQGSWESFSCVSDIWTEIWRIIVVSHWEAEGNVSGRGNNLCKDPVFERGTCAWETARRLVWLEDRRARHEKGLES